MQGCEEIVKNIPSEIGCTPKKRVARRADIQRHLAAAARRTAEAAVAGLLEVLADVRLVVPAYGGAQVGGGADRALAHHAARRVARGGVASLDVLRVVVDAAVDLVVRAVLQPLNARNTSVAVRRSLLSTVAEAILLSTPVIIYWHN